MAFESLSEKLQGVFKNLRSKGRLTEDDVKAAMREVKRALLEADVNFKVVKTFIKSVQERAVGQDVLNGLNPGQMVIKIVKEEMEALMGSTMTEIQLRPGNEITIILMAGLQGAGKTTTCAKLAGQYKKEINTTDPEYYKWTQWIFIQMFKNGLAYEKEMPLNWCPNCKAVLANEEATNGVCDRCGATVTKKNLRQWMLRITKYADRLLNDLDKLDWPEKVKKMQSDWIGKSYGAEID